MQCVGCRVYFQPAVEEHVLDGLVEPLDSREGGPILLDPLAPDHQRELRRRQRLCVECV